MSEFDLINKYFKSNSPSRRDVLVGIGDDCAVLQVPDNRQLVMTADTLIAGVHFPTTVAAADIGYKALAVSLSDIAAMGGIPAWAMLAITLPVVDHNWLADFMRGFMELATAYNVQLIGGDTTSGPLSMTITLTGFVTPGVMLRRDAARPGEKIYVSGSLGDAALGLQYYLQQISSTTSLNYCVSRLNRPTPRVQLGQELLAYSRCGIDISDGLLADLSHVCRASDCAARIFLQDLPLSDELQSFYKAKPDWCGIVAGGDDYELCFTVPAQHQHKVSELAQALKLKLTCIGEIQVGSGVHCFDSIGNEVTFETTGYNHFAKIHS